MYNLCLPKQEYKGVIFPHVNHKSKYSLAMVLMAVIGDIISYEGSEVQLCLSCCIASHTTGRLLPLPKADVMGILLFSAMVCHKPCEMLLH